MTCSMCSTSPDAGAPAITQRELCACTAAGPCRRQFCHARSHLTTVMLPTSARMQIFTPEQQLAFELQGASFKLHVGSLNVDVNGQSKEVPRAYLATNTAFIFTNSSRCWLFQLQCRQFDRSRPSTANIERSLHRKHSRTHQSNML